MLSKNLLTKLNTQVTLELFSSNLYLQMSAWCEHQGLNGSAKFLKAHAAEEMQHMYKLFEYIQDTGALAIIEAIDKPDIEFENIRDVFMQTYAHERMITAQINELVGIALSEKDYSTFNFLQWYVAEQHEEEKLFKGIVDKIEMIGIEGRGIFLIDSEIGNIIVS